MAATIAGPDVERLRGFFREGAPGPNAHVVLLGLSIFDTTDLVIAIQKGFRYQTFERFRRNIALPVETIMALVSIPRRTLTRRKIEGRFAPEESDRLVRASRVYSKALQLFDGDSTAASRWLITPQRGLGGEAPVALSSTDVGAREVERLIDRLEHGVFA
ncbi:MAG: antitoxin Xre/MbcA/ParS toxin-binding domain-containing protein [Vicinamibacterales bacterium]